MSILKGMIVCGVCKKNYKKIMQRSRTCLICSGYTNYGSDFCSRRVVEEESIIQVLKMGFFNNELEFHRDSEYISQHVKEIIVDEEGNIEVKFHKYPSIKWDQNGIQISI